MSMAGWILIIKHKQGSKQGHKQGDGFHKQGDGS